MTAPVQVKVTFLNGSTALVDRSSYLAAREYCRKAISYSGGRVQRVEIVCPDGSVIAIWDKSWDAVSQSAGLNN